MRKNCTFAPTPIAKLLAISSSYYISYGLLRLGHGISFVTHLRKCMPYKLFNGWPAARVRGFRRCRPNARSIVGARISGLNIRNSAGRDRPNSIDRFAEYEQGSEFQFSGLHQLALNPSRPKSRVVKNPPPTAKSEPCDRPEPSACWWYIIFVSVMLNVMAGPAGRRLQTYICPAIRDFPVCYCLAQLNPRLISSATVRLLNVVDGLGRCHPASPFAFGLRNVRHIRSIVIYRRLFN